MAERSSGLLLFRRRNGVEVMLVHPGGPFWAKKDLAGWSIPKGLMDPAEESLAAARREFAEETGSPAPDGAYLALGDFRQGSGKIVTAYAIEADFDADGIRSNTFTMEWPPRSGRSAKFPEVDRAAWFGLEEAATRIHKGQQPILAALTEALSGASPIRR